MVYLYSQKRNRKSYQNQFCLITIWFQNSKAVYSMTMSGYAEVHLNPGGLGHIRLIALQVVKDDGVEGKLAGKVSCYQDIVCLS